MDEQLKKDAYIHKIKVVQSQAFDYFINMVSDYMVDTSIVDINEATRGLDKKHGWGLSARDSTFEDIWVKWAKKIEEILYLLAPHNLDEVFNYRKEKLTEDLFNAPLEDKTMVKPMVYEELDQ